MTAPRRSDVALLKVTLSGSPTIRIAKCWHESSQGYRGFVAQLNAHWRVVECRDGIQWILQRKDGLRNGQPRWTGRSYFRSREALIRACRTSPGIIDDTALDCLGALPLWVEVRS